LLEMRGNQVTANPTINTDLGVLPLFMDGCEKDQEWTSDPLTTDPIPRQSVNTHINQTRKQPVHQSVGSPLLKYFLTKLKTKLLV